VKAGVTEEERNATPETKSAVLGTPSMKATRPLPHPSAGMATEVFCLRCLFDMNALSPPPV